MSADEQAPTDAPTARPPHAWPQALLDALAADPRVLGAADGSDERCTGGVFGPGRVPTLLVVSTWDGLAPLTRELGRLGALALGEDAAASWTDTTSVRAAPGARWEGMTAALRRVEIGLVRVGDLKPSQGGERAAVVFDRSGVVDQWVRWSRGRDRSRDAAAPTPERDAVWAARRRLVAEETVRQFESMPVGSMRAIPDGTLGPMRPLLAGELRLVRAGLASGSAVDAALAARIDAALATVPNPGAGYRVVPGAKTPAETLDAFLRIADGEGFLGDRVLFDAAAKRLAELSGQPPVFDEGFVLPTFDAVEARWRFGEGIGGCKTPLVPCVHVGVGVTPADHLEFWAAPAVREAMCDVACVSDAGTRVVVPRTAGKDAFFSALHGEVDRAWDELPEFVRTARRAGRTPAGDAESALKPLHLPKSYREAAKRVVGAAVAPSRLQVALALARAGSGEEPLNARKFGLAAGRLVALTPPGGDEASQAGCDDSTAA